MSLPVILTPEAEEEYEEAYSFYESRRTGLGEDFADKVQAVFLSIGRTPRRSPVVYKDGRKAVVPVFPYCVYFHEIAGAGEVFSVFHTSRNPAIWQARLGS